MKPVRQVADLCDLTEGQTSVPKTDHHPVPFETFFSLIRPKVLRAVARPKDVNLLKTPLATRRLLVMRRGKSSPAVSSGCDVQGCSSTSRRYQISRNGVIRSVCQACMLELVGIGGWTNIGVVGGVLHRRAANLPTD